MGVETYSANQGPWSSDAGTKKEKTLLERLLKDYRYVLDHPDWSGEKGIWKQAELDDRALSVSGPWTDSDRDDRNKSGQERPCIHLDQLSQYVNSLINEARSNPIGIKAEPAGGQANEKTAELRANRIRAIEFESTPDAAMQARLTAFESMASRGFGFYGITIDYKSWDDFRQVIKYRSFLNSYSILIDPDIMAPDASDMRFAFVLSRIMRDIFPEEYPHAQITSFGTEHLEGGWIDDSTVQVAEYWYIDKKKLTMFLVDSPHFPGKPFKVFKEKLSKEIKLPDGNIITLENAKVTDDAILLRDGSLWATIKDERTTFEPKIYMCKTNGLEILTEPEEWPGKWIPIFPLIGKQKFERHGNKTQRVIESYIRKGRDGQMLFDFYVSSEAENVGMTAKRPAKGYEGQFEGHEEEWATVHKVPRGYIEAHAKTEEGGDTLLSLPEFDVYDPPIAALEIGKESTRRSIQASIGSYGVTRLDDTNVKSGIALERLKAQNDMGSYHFMDALKVMVQHDGRVVNDLLDNVETDTMDVGLRTMGGEYSVKRINEPGPVNEEEPNAYRLTDEDQFEISISVGKPYQSQREEDAEVSDALVQNIIPISQVVGPEIAKQMIGTTLKLRQLGPDFDKIIKQLLPQEGKQPDAQALMAQVEQTMQLAEQLGQRVQALELEKQGKLLDLESRENIAAMQAQLEKLRIDVDAYKAKFQAEQADKDRQLQAATTEATLKSKEDMTVFESDRAMAQAQIDRVAAESSKQSEQA